MANPRHGNLTSLHAHRLSAEGSMQSCGVLA